MIAAAVVALATFAVWVTVVVLTTSRRWEHEQPPPKSELQPRKCRITGCRQPATHVWPTSCGTYAACTTHATTVRDWVGPYDQDLDLATDLGQWNNELDAS